MKIQDLYKYKGLLLILLARLHVIIAKDVIIPIDLDPDCDISEYGRETVQGYFFHNKWSFKHECRYIINAEILGNKIYNSELLMEDAAENYDDFGISDYSDVHRCLNAINAINEKFFLENGCDADEVNDFRLRDLRIRNIDNIHQNICYEGGFMGDNIDMDSSISGWELFSKFRFIGVCNNISEFYRELLGESYVLYAAQNYKLSFFLAYSAFECFINTKGGTQRIDGRLKDKIADLYRSKFTDLSKHQIYTSVIDKFNASDKKRNDIAHGREEVIIDEDKAAKMLLHIIAVR